jgi:hypothetical protein
VITLLADRQHRATAGGLNASWPYPAALFVAVGIVGLLGLAYAVIVVVWTLRQKTYEPVWQDWLWYTVLPGVSYAALAITALLRTTAPRSFFVIGAPRSRSCTTNCWSVAFVGSVDASGASESRTRLNTKSACAA